MSKTVITEYDIVFSLHTGVTIMMQLQSAFDESAEDELPFSVSEDGDTSAVDIKAPAGRTVTIDNIKSNMLAEIKGRGFFMIYEFDGDDMARCTPCHLEIVS